MTSQVLGDGTDVAWWNEVKPLIEGVARATYWKYRKWVEMDDMVQEAWLAYIANRKTLDGLRDSPSGIGYVRRRIQSACTIYAVKEMCAKTGVQWEDQFFYRAGEVRALVTLVLSGGPQGTEGENTVAGYVDVRNALQWLQPEDRDVLWMAYGPDSVDRALTATERSRAARVIKRVQRVLNGEELNCLVLTDG